MKLKASTLYAEAKEQGWLVRPNPRKPFDDGLGLLCAWVAYTGKRKLPFGVVTYTRQWAEVELNVHNTGRLLSLDEQASIMKLLLRRSAFPGIKPPVVNKQSAWALVDSREVGNELMPQLLALAKGGR